MKPENPSQQKQQQQQQKKPQQQDQQQQQQKKQPFGNPSQKQDLPEWEKHK